MTKPEVRKKYKSLRESLSWREIEDKSLHIANRVLQLDVWQHDFYHLFLTITELHEVNTDYLHHILAGKDKNMVVSRSDFSDGSMKHFLLTDSTLFKKNSHNIPEPVDGVEVPPKKIDVVFVPLLAFDRQGNRVGYGKGFYDRFLQRCRRDVVKIGLSFFGPEEASISTDPGDVALDYCVTPEQAYGF